MPDIEVTAIRPVPTEPELRGQLAEIEASIEAGNYSPGPWDKFIRAARNQPDEVRTALADDASRVSRKLHMRTGRTTMPVAKALLLEGVGTVAGAVLLGIGVSSGAGVISLLGALIWVGTFQPLVKIGVGTWFGINNDYAYLETSTMEPRFKIRYGTYLAQPRWKRIVFHLAGIVGSPLGLATAAALMRPVEPTTAEVCMAIFWILNAVNLAAFFGGLSARRKLGPIRVAISSGGVAGVECREAWGLDRR